MDDWLDEGLEVHPHRCSEVLVVMDLLFSMEFIFLLLTASLLLWNYFTGKALQLPVMLMDGRSGKCCGPCCSPKRMLRRKNRKLVRPKEDILTHLAWVKHNVLMRHSQSFPLLIFYFDNFCINGDILWIHISRQGGKKKITHAEQRLAATPIANSVRVQPSSLRVTEDLRVLMAADDIVMCAEGSERTKDCDDLSEASHGPHHVAQSWDNRSELSVFITHQYPDNHNPLLPVPLQKRLDGMSPREFLNYVLSELTLEERESLMVDERQRRKTFLTNWPHSSHLSGVNMAKSGFYCVDDFDRVQCVFCRGCLHRWEPDDVPMREHARSFTFCRFVKGLECGNREFRSDMLNEEDIKNIKLFGNPELTKNADGTVSIDGNSLGISTKKADTARYAPEASRTSTFSRWPSSHPISPQRLCEAGFYYTGFNDQVRCFYCSGMLKEWSIGDNPFEEHARWFPDCSFLVQKKGSQWIDQVHQRTPANKKCPRSTTSQRVQEKQEKELKSDEEAMIDICKKLGHSSINVHAAISIKKGLIDSIGTLIEAVYEIDEKGDGTLRDEASYDAADAAIDVDIPDEDRDRATTESDSVTVTNLRDIANTYPGVDGACITCYRKSGKFINADHIGLPCGHMIWCERCSQEETIKATDSQSNPRCPAVNCGAPLTAAFKTFYA